MHGNGVLQRCNELNELQGNVWSGAVWCGVCVAVQTTCVWVGARRNAMSGTVLSTVVWWGTSVRGVGVAGGGHLVAVQWYQPNGVIL